MKFSELGLQTETMEALTELGFEDCTPIQEASMQLILEGKDVAGLAQTGTGKTAAFVVPLIDRILKAKAGYTEHPERCFTQWEANQFILVLVPTRELAEQVFENFKLFKGKTALKGVSIYGGVAYEKQKQALNSGVEFIIATPGRLIDLFKEHLVDLRQVRAIVFDEADRMFDMGFKDDMKYILQRVPKDRQFLVFSATLNFDVTNVAYQFGANPVEVNVSRDQARAENVEDKILHVGHTEKPANLLAVLRKIKPKQAIVFSNFKLNVERLAQFLTSNGVPAVGISSLLTQAQRNRVMSQFKGENDQNILVATDVAARGLDIKGVDLVVNYELPDDAENYVHRIGRTGRANEKGLALSLVSERDVDALTRIEEYLKHKLARDWLEDADLVKDFTPFQSERWGERKKSEFKSRPPSRDRGPRRPERGNDRPDRGRDDRNRDDRNRDRNFDRSANRGPDRGGPRERDNQRPPLAGDRNQENPRHQRPHAKKHERREHSEVKAGKGGRRTEDRKLSAGARKHRPPIVPKTAVPSAQTRETNKVPTRTLSQKVTKFFKKIFG